MTNSNIFEVQLPSFQANIPNYPKRVRISTLTVQSFKLYATINESNMFSVMKNILNLCIVEPKFDIGSLKFQDFMYLSMWLRINSAIPGSSNEYEYQATCSHCGKEFKRKCDLSKIPIDYLSSEYKEPEKINLYSEEGQTLDLRILSLDDEIELFNMINSEDKLIRDNAQTIRSAYSIQSNYPLKDKVVFIDSLTDVRDLATIIDFQNTYSEWGFSFKDNEVSCPHCKKFNHLVIPLSFDTLVPKLQTDGYFKKSRVT